MESAAEGVTLLAGLSFYDVVPQLCIGVEESMPIAPVYSEMGDRNHSRVEGHISFPGAFYRFCWQLIESFRQVSVAHNPQGAQ